MSAHAVIALPGSPYEGMEVDYHPGGALSGSPVWRCVWRAALNSGSGAWAFVGGGPLIDVQSSGGNQTTASVSTWAGMTNSPSITVPVTGVYDVTASGWIQGQTSATNALVRIIRSTGPTEILRAANHYSADAFEASMQASVPVRASCTGAETVSLQVATDNKSNNFGGGAPWRLSLTPVELRP